VTDEKRELIVLHHLHLKGTGEVDEEAVKKRNRRKRQKKLPKNEKKNERKSRRKRRKRRERRKLKTRKTKGKKRIKKSQPLGMGKATVKLRKRKTLKSRSKQFQL